MTTGMSTRSGVPENNRLGVQARADTDSMTIIEAIEIYFSIHDRLDEHFKIVVTIPYGTKPIGFV